MNKTPIFVGSLLSLAILQANAGVVVEGAPGSATQLNSQQNTSTVVDTVQPPRDFQWRRPGQSPTISANVNSFNDNPSAVTETGSRPSQVSSAGWAKDLPLDIALKEIIPTDFVLKTNGVNLNKTVSWTENLPWNIVLKTLANTGDFVANINWDLKEVSLAPRSLTAVNDISTKQPQRLVSSPAFVPAVKPLTPPVETWVLDSTLSLRQNIENWGKKAGWTVIWEGADYPIVAKATFTGDFASPDGPLAKLIAAYDNSEKPLVAELTTLDKVVNIQNKKNKSVQVLQTSPQTLAQKK